MMQRKGPSVETGAIPKKSITADRPNHTADGRQIAWDNAATWWKSCANQAMKTLIDDGRAFTVDEFTRLMPAPDRPQRVGSVIAAWYRAGQIQVVGAAISGENDRPVRIWQAVGGGRYES